MMSKHRYAVLLTAVIVIGGFLLAGCSGNKEASGEELVITIWRPENTDGIEKWWAERIALFNETYAGTYRAVQERFPKGGAQGYEDKINTAVISNSLPELILVDGPSVASYAENDIIVPIDEFVSAADKADLLESVMEQNSYGGKLYTLSLWDSSVALFYNKKMLADAGIEAPKTQAEAWTWDEFYGVVKQLRTNDRFGCTFHTNSGQILYYYSPMLVQNGTDLMSPDGSAAEGYLNSPKTVEFLNWLKRFYDEKLVNIEPTPTEFADGKSAMLLGGANNIDTLNSKYPDLDWDVTYYPVSNSRVAATPTGSWTVGMTTNTKNKAAAFVLLDFMTNTDANITGCPASGYLPPRKSSQQALPQYNNPPYRVFMDQLANSGAPRPRTPVFTVLNPTFGSVVSDVITGSNPKEKLDEAARRVDADYQMNYAR
ncbi:extracellular solute-binding protein [Breznakiella homolactica]|uniref:Extracellular solute-binding protein n=1 Tax=Breznakiella homolactica TaxID=2798577 RepID=A0A7T7XJB8_9SPIR|nr:extracellular solute-binding protein [Breznakiella homolactica]QQO07484.1 extracellular solute-binding protein [Breznakiella homolactica]